MVPSSTPASQTIHDELADITTRFVTDLQNIVERLECEVRLKASQILEQEAQISALQSELRSTQLQVPRRHDFRGYKIRVRLPPITAPISFQKDLSTDPTLVKDPPSPAMCSSQSATSSPRVRDSSTSPVSVVSVRTAPNAGSDADPIANQAKEIGNDFSSALEDQNLTHMRYRKLIQPRSQKPRQQRLLKKEMISKGDLRTFTLFSELPLQLQQKVWLYTLPRRGRIVELCDTTSIVSEGYKTFCTLPIAFQVCRISREEALKVYQPLEYSVILRDELYVRFGAISCFIAEAYLDFNIDTLLLTRSKDQTYEGIHSDLYCCIQAPEIRQLAIDFDVWDCILSHSTFPKALAQMRCLETLAIVWDSANGKWGGSASEVWPHVKRTLTEESWKHPELGKVIPKVRFGTLSRTFGIGKKYSANIRYLSALLVRTGGHERMVDHV